MGLENINDLVRDSIENIKSLIQVDEIMGNPIESGAQTIIPVSKMTVGFVSGGANKMGDRQKGEEMPIGASGGGVNLVPIGFLIINGEETHFIKTQGDNIDKWLDIVQTSIKSIIK